MEPVTRRLKNIALSEQHVADLLIRGENWPKILGVVRIRVPLGTKLVSVDHDKFTRMFVFTITHPTFDEVAPGDPIPPFDKFGYDARVYERVDK